MGVSERVREEATGLWDSAELPQHGRPIAFSTGKVRQRWCRALCPPSNDTDTLPEQANAPPHAAMALVVRGSSPRFLSCTHQERNTIAAIGQGVRSGER